MRSRGWCAVITVVFLCALAFAQQPGVSVRAQAPPPLVKLSGVLPSNQRGTVAVTFALYKEATGGAPLWLETQNVAVDANGRYTIFLGTQHAGGLPVDLFSTGEARWLGVQSEGQPEQARVLLVSVPYALKAGDADTLAGHSLSEFVLASPKNAALSSTDYVNATAVTQAAYAISGADTNALPKFTSAAGDMTSSAIYELNGNLGIGTSSPARSLHIKSASPNIRIEDTHFANSFWELQQSAYVDDWFGFLRYDTSQGSFGAVPARSMIISNDGRFGLGVTDIYNNMSAKVNIGAGNLRLWGSAGTDGVIFPDGSKQTTAYPGSAAFVNSVVTAPGSGLTSNTAAGAVTLSTDTTVLQKRVGSSCAAGTAISAIGADGTVVCQTISGGGALIAPVNVSGTATAPAGVMNITDTVNGPADTQNGPPDPNTLPSAIVGLASGTGITVGVLGKATGPDGVGVIGLSTQSEAPAMVAWSQATGLSNDATALNAMLANAGGKVVDAQSTATSGQVSVFRGKTASPSATGLEFDFAVTPAWIINTNNNSFSVDGTGNVNASGLHLTNGGAIIFGDGTRQTTASTGGGGGTNYTAGVGLNLSGNQFSNTGVLSVAANGVLSASGGQNPTISLSGTVPTSNGGTGLNSSGPAGTFLRSNGTSWTPSTIQASDLPSMSANYVDLSSTQTIAGAKTFSTAINANITGNANTVTNGVYSIGTYADPAWLTSLSAGKLTGTLAKTQIPAAAVYTDQANTFTAGKQDFSGAAATLPFKAVLSAATPTTCVANKEVIVKTDAPAGQQLFQCNSSGTGWNTLGGGSVSLSSPDGSITVGGSGTAPTVALNVAATDTRYAPITGSANYAPATGSPNYAPNTGSTNYAPISGSTNYLAKTGDSVTLAANGLQMAGNQIVTTGGQFGYGAAPNTIALFDIAGTYTAPTYTAHLFQVDGTVKSNGGYAQAYLRGINVAPTFDVTNGYANYLVGVETYMGGKVGNNVAHSVVGYHLNGQPTSGQECSVGFGISVPNQQTSLCNGKYGFYQGDTAAQYNYFASAVGIGTPFPAQPLHVKGNAQVDGNLILSGSVSGSATQALNLTSGASEPINLSVPTGTGSGAAVGISAGNAGNSSGGTGGNLNLTAGNAMAQGGAGWTNAGPGGSVNVTAGAGYNTVGGNVVLTSGSTSTWALSATYSKVSLKGGIANTGDGATIDVEGGHTTGSPAGPAPSIGGNVVIKAGAGNGGTSTLAGGNIVLQAGTGSPNGTVQLKSDTQITGNLTASGNGAMPVYNSAGTAQSSAHMVTGTLNFAGGTFVVTLNGAAAFSNSSSYVCTVSGSGVQPFGVTNNAGNAFAISGPADSALKYICVGN